MLGRVADSPSKTFNTLTSAFIIGLALHAFDERPWLPAGCFAYAVMPAAAAAAVSGNRHRCRLVFAAVAVFLLALWRFEAAVAGLQEPQPLPADARWFTGTIDEEPRQGIRNTILIMDRVFISDGASALLPGRMQLKFNYPLPVRYGDSLEWSCGPEPVVLSDKISVADGLFLKHVAWQCFLRQPPRLLSAGNGNALKQMMFGFKSRLREIAGALVPEPESSFLLGLLIGERQGIPEELADSFRLTGTSHILAVSGYNVSRLIEVFFILCACAAVRRRRAVVPVSLVIAGFAVMVGGEASVVRAAAMGGISLLAVLYGRRYGSSGALAAAAAIMLAANPLILRHDVGFQLSFAAVLGLQMLGQPLTRQLGFIPEFLELRKTAGETLAATIMTTPIVLSVFGRLPLVGPAVNMLVLPLIPWAMSTGALALVAGAVHPLLGLPPAFLTASLLRLIESIVRLAAAIPFSIVVDIGPVTVTILYFWIILLWFALTRARPIVLTRRCVPSEMEVEVIDYDQR